MKHNLPKLSAQHFRFLAGALAPFRGVIEPDVHDQVCGALASLCEETNAKFNRERFLKACGARKNS